MTTLFLFGAGASAFCGPHPEALPPTGALLFPRLRQRQGFAASLSGDMAAAFEGDFEVGLAKLMDEREREKHKLLLEVAEFLAEFSINGPSAYTTLIEGIVRTRRAVVFSTLNYDLLIEEAIEGMRCRFAYRYVESSPHSFPVLKIHGSCNSYPTLEQEPSGEPHSKGTPRMWRHQFVQLRGRKPSGTAGRVVAG